MSSVWPKFPTAKCSLVIDILSEPELLLNNKVIKTIDCHYFSQNIQLISTNEQLIPIFEEYMSSTKTLSYCLVKNMPIYVLIDKIFLNAFFKKGKLFGLSVNKEIDLDDCSALLPNGLIILSLKESTYHRLGIIGKKSILYKNKSLVQKYLVEIDLTKDYFKPGTKHYRRTYECLQRSGLSFDFIIKWEVNEELSKDSISSMSIKNFFSYLKTNSNDSKLNSMQFFGCSPYLTKFNNNCVPIPILCEEHLFEDIKQLIEWFGAQVCQIDCNQLEDTDVSTFAFPNSQQTSDVFCLQLNGFFTHTDISRLIIKLKELLKIGTNSMIVNGFENTPISWKGSNNEHNKSLSGENLYGLGFHNSKQFIWRIADEYDFGIERL